MIIYSDNQTDIANVTASPSSVNYPPSNVKDSRLERIYKGDEQIDFDISGSGSLKNISQAYTNLVQDPTDLTTGNWAGANVAVTDTGETLLGEIIWEVASSVSGTFRFLETAQITTSSDIIVYRGITRKGTSNKTGLKINNVTTASQAGTVSVQFDTKELTPSGGAVLLDYTWLDNDTVELVVLADSGSITIGDNIEYQIFANFDVSDTTNTFWTQPQLTEGSTTMYPFIDGSKSADVIDETFTMPDRFTFDMIVTPNFAYDDSANRRLFVWFIDSTHYLRLIYLVSADAWRLDWIDEGGSLAVLQSQQFDDGTSFTNINQRIRLTVSLDLISGGVSDSRLITTPLENGNIFEDSSFGSTPSIKTSTFNTLSIGYDGTSADQANSSYEYLRIYEGLLVGDVTSSDDVTELLKDKKILLDNTYQQKLTATDILIANSTINDGDTITLRANDVDSYGAGTPLDETITWSKDITKHNFALSSYQFWRLSVNSSNVISIGRIYLGENYQLPEILPTVEHQFVDPSIKTRTASNETYGDIRDPYTILDVNYPIVPYAQKTELMEIFREIGSYTPVFFKFGEIGIDIPSIYGTINQASISASMLDDGLNYSIGFSIIEEL